MKMKMPISSPKLQRKQISFPLAMFSSFAGNLARRLLHDHGIENDGSYSDGIYRLSRIVHEGGLTERDRALCWLVFFRILPLPETDWTNEGIRSVANEYNIIWKASISKKLEEYVGFCRDFLAPQSSAEQQGDHPLSDDSQSSWKQYFVDREVKDQIHRDVSRTQIEMSFFRGEFQPSGSSMRTKYPVRYLFITN